MLARALATAPLLLLAPSLAEAQIIRHILTAPPEEETTGVRVSRRPATSTATGVGDLLVGQTNVALFPVVAGEVHVYSGATATLLLTLTGSSPNAAFGHDVANLGDVTGDGVDDWAVAEPWAGGNQGAAHIYTGAGGTLLNTIAWSGGNFGFAWSVSGVGDLNGDGTPDLLVGAPNAGQGAVRVYSPLTGDVIHTLLGGPGTDRFGRSVNSAGDVDGDGVNDILVGAPNEGSGPGGPGSAYAFSGASGVLLHKSDGPGSNTQHGTSVAGVGDVDGDGLSDYVVGGQLDNSSAPNGGRVTLHSGANGAVLFTDWGIHAQGVLGISSAGVGDVNGDGIPDYAAGAPGANGQGLLGGYMRVYSGLDGSEIYTYHGATSTFTVAYALGYAITGLGDLDGDGRPEIAVSNSTGCTGNGGYGRIHILSSPSTSVTTTCIAPVLNSQGSRSWLRLIGAPEVAQNSLVLQAYGMAPGQFGYFLASRDSGLVMGPNGSQGNLCLGGSIGRFNANIFNSGSCREAQLAIDLTALPTPTGTAAAAVGEAWYFQCWYRDANPTPTSNFSSALRVVLQ